MRARHTAAAAIATTFVVLWIGVSAAGAAPADYVLSSDKATIEGDDEPTVGITLINLTDQPATVELATSEGGNNCVPSDEELPARQETELTFTLKDCDFGDEKTVALTLEVEGVTFKVTARNGEESTPNWDILWTYTGSFGAGLLLIIAGWIWFLAKPPAALSTKNNVGPTTPLPYLGATWSFKDSWAANVTLVSAVFTGIFGSSDLLKSVTGAEAPSTLALITIASAIGVALVGLGPLVLQALRNDKSEVIAGGLFLSAAIAVGTAGGLALIIIRSVEGAVSGSAKYFLWGGGVLALALLAVYAVTSIRQNLITGLTEPPPEAEGLTEAQRQALFDAIRAQLDSGVTDKQLRDEIVPVIEGVVPTSYPRSGTSPGDYPAAYI
ncbi:hypothetical protein AB0F44_06455 [Nocardioides sp. NPDC023903]|uniref:hypothetical protein n=1 Tax=Nocardioides sp. NPDC023903 TaxID=3157195 RepID=UPI0033FEC3B1